MLTILPDKLVDLNLKASPTSLGKLINGLKRTLKLRKFKRKYEIDCSISFMESANLPNVLSRVAGEKVVISFHSSSISRRFTTINSSADRIIGVSEGVSILYGRSANCLFLKFEQFTIQ